MSRWPNLFVVGVPKAGTTTLYLHLRTHPQVYMADLKEPHFLSRDYPPSALEPFVRTVRDEAEYLRLFDSALEPVVGEASTSYFADAEAPRRISELAPGAKVVVVLRDPVKRAYSHYLNHVREGLERRSFQAAIEEEIGGHPPGGGSQAFRYVNDGIYADRILLHRRLFGASFKVVFFEELFEDLRAGLGDLYRFLAVDPGHANSADVSLRANPYAMPARGLSRSLVGSASARRLARSALPRSIRDRVRSRLLRQPPKPGLPPAAATRLEGAYAPDRERLEEILERPMPW